MFCDNMAKYNKMTGSNKANNVKMPKTCVICGKSLDRMVTNERYPESPICITCFNGFAFNLKTIEEELAPLVDDLMEVLNTIDQNADQK